MTKSRSSRQDPTSISIVDLNTGGVVDEFDLGGREPVGLPWVRPPDGHELIMVAHPAPGAPDFALYGFNLDTGVYRQIGAPASDTSGLPLSDGLRCTMCDLRLSPDGTTVAYWSRENQPAVNPGDDWYPHARDLDTGVDVPLPLGGMRAGVVFTFAPDGATFGFRWDELGRQNMVVGPLDSSAPATSLGLPFDASVDGEFDFSPDGTKLYPHDQDTRGDGTSTTSLVVRTWCSRGSRSSRHGSGWRPREGDATGWVGGPTTDSFRLVSRPPLVTPCGWRRAPELVAATWARHPRVLDPGPTDRVPDAWRPVLPSRRSSPTTHGA